jgi:hypothetical protein
MAKEPKPVPLGPWPLGVNNVDVDRAAAFQASKARAAQLRAAVNVDLDREGWPRRRVGRIKRMDLSDGHSLASVGGLLLCVDDGALLRVDTEDWSTQVLGQVGGEPLSYAEAGGAVWVLSAGFRGALVGGALSFWGLEPPAPPVLSATAGQLPAGRYQVALTVEATAANGALVESGARAVSTLTLEAPGAIEVTAAGLDANAELVNLYCSEPNGRELYFVGALPVDAAPWRIEQVAQTTDLLDGLGEYPPPLGQIVRAYRGRLLVASGAALYWSGPLAYHRFRLRRDVQLFADELVLLEPTLDGFYAATKDRLWWVGGDDPETWQSLLLGQEMVPAGAAVRVPGSALPALETASPVLVWATERGFVAGLPGAQLRWLTDGRVALPGHGKASLAFREQDGLRQVVLSLCEPRPGGGQAQLASTDVASCEVIKASAALPAPRALESVAASDAAACEVIQAPAAGYEWLMVSDGAGGFEQLMVSDGAGGFEPLAVLEE